MALAKRGSNKIIITDENFDEVVVRTAGEIIPTHGFSSFKVKRVSRLIYSSGTLFCAVSVCGTLTYFFINMSQVVHGLRPYLRSVS